MESYKFYVIHVLLDTVLAAIVFILFYVGWSNTLSIAAIPNTVVLLLICFIGYKTITMKGFINSLADVSITILVYIGYLYAVHNGDDLLQKNYWFVQVFRGFAFASFAVLLITFIKRYVSAYLKYAQIYYVSCGHKGSVLHCFSGAVSWVEFSTILEKFPLYGRTPVEIKIAAAKLGFTSDPYTWNYDIIRLAVTFNQPLTDDLCATLSRYMLSHRSEMQALYLLCLCDINMSKIMKLGVATKANLNKIADELGVKSYSSFKDVQGMVLSVKDKCSVCAVIMNNFEGVKIDWMYRLLEKYNVHQIIPCKLYEHEFNSVILVMHGKVLGVWPITDAYYCMKTIIGDTKCYLTYKAWKDSLIIGDKTSAMNYRLPLVTFGSPSEKLLKLYQECIADDGESVVSYHLHKVLDARIADVLMESSDAWKYFKLLCLQHDNKTWISMAKRQDLGFQGFNTFAPMSHVEDNIFKTMFRFCCDIKYTELLNNAPDDFPRYVEVSGKIYDTALVIANDLSLKEALKSVDIRQLLVSSEKVEVLHA